jgi:hypothetical protein
MGDVARALLIAKDQKNDDLEDKLSRLDSTLSSAREKLGAGEHAAALKNFLIAHKLDHEISYGVGVYAAQIRKQLASLYILEANSQVESENPQGARQSFTLALKYDSASGEAKAGLRKLDASVVRPPVNDGQPEENSVPPPTVKVRRPPNRERAAEIDAAFGG